MRSDGHYSGAMCEVLHFAVDPFVDRRLPLAAVLTLEAARVLIPAIAPPDSHCAGGWQAAMLAAEALNALRSQPSAGDIPCGFEEVIVRGRAQRVPHGWGEREVREFVWGPPSRVSMTQRGKHARTTGREIFRRHGLDMVVRDSLDPEAEFQGRFVAASSGGTVPQFVVGSREQLLLLEPLAENASKAIEDAAIQRLAVWQSAMRRHPEWPRITLGTYAVPRGPDARGPQRTLQLERVAEFADMVIDARTSLGEQALVDAVRAAAA
jgi:hypothetical protein